MRLLKGSFKMCRRFLLIFFVIYVNSATSDRIPIGVVFDQKTDQIQQAFKMAMFQHANPATLDFQVYVDVINTADAFKLSRLICNQFGRGVVAMLAAVHPDSFDTLHSYANTFNMPFVTPFFPEKVLPPTTGFMDYAVSILPDYHKAVIDTVMYYGWKNVIYLYDSHDGMIRLQQLFKSLIPGKQPFFRITNVKRFTTAMEVIDYLRQLERADRWSNKYVILDCGTALAKETLIMHVRDVQLGRRNYHYLFSGLVMDDRWEKEIKEYGSVNLTGFRVVDTARKFVKEFLAHWKKDNVSAKAALMYDAAFVVIDTFRRMGKNNPEMLQRIKQNNKSRVLTCDSPEAVPLKYGDTITELIKQTRIDGLSGPIRITENGIRKNFSLHIFQNTPDGEMIKVATWYDGKGFIAVRAKKRPLDVSGKYDRNKTYIVISMNEPPYFMSDKPLSEIGNETDISYEGFCADLAEMIADKLEIKIAFRMAKDGQYGDENPKIEGSWDGIVGELVRKEADMAVAPLIITRSREMVVDFSRPFLSFNRKPSSRFGKERASLLFLKPLAPETWYSLAVSVFAVSFVMYLVTRFSPSEWRMVSVTETSQALEQTENAVTKTSIINEFSFFNSLWYSLGSLMQQGSDLAPRSFSGRIVSASWWFFTLIIVCSYTANMTSFLTLTGIENTRRSEYNKLANCPEDLEEKGQIMADDEIHGSGEGGFSEFMLTKRNNIRSVSNCEMMISVNDDGIRDFAVAFPKGSKLRVGVNLALIALKEEGELHRLMRKWFRKNECSPPDTSAGGELTLGQISGLFYVLFSGMALGLAVALIEFCNYHRSEAAKANITISTALRAKTRLSVTEREEPPSSNRRRRREQDRAVWNGSGAAGTCVGVQGPFEAEMRGQTMTVRRRSAGYSSPSNTMPPKRAIQQRTRQNVNQEMQENRQAMAPRSYFTPAAQAGQEETALHASFTQV